MADYDGLGPLAIHLRPGSDCVPRDLRSFISELRDDSTWNELRAALADDRLAVFDDDYFEELSDAISMATELHEQSSIQQLAELQQALSYGSQFVIELIHDLKLQSLGEWGARFFHIFIDSIHEGEWTKLSETIYYQELLKPYVGNFDADKVQDGISSLCGPIDCPVLDSTTYTVVIDGRTACELGNTNYFRLLEVLVQRVNQYVSFVDIAEKIGLGEIGADSIPATKCRLLRLLRKSGLEDLADSVRTQTQHYGLFVKPILPAGPLETR